MEENKKEEKVVNTEELKKETVDTVNQVKDTIKNVDIKNDAKEATGFVSAMFKDPFAKMKEIANDEKNKNFKIAVIFLVIWMVVAFIEVLLTTVSFSYWSGNLFISRLWSIVVATLAPTVSVIVLALIVFLMNKKAKKSLLTTITSIAVAKIPVIIAEVVGLITLLNTSAGRITNRFYGFCSVITIVLTYFSIKALCNEEQNSKFIKTFVIIEAIFYAVAVLVSLVLGMSI